ncbi:Ribosomal RNA-processing protein 8 [Melipona quadrifasciata]|uniref:Ribosomal RNA-processing protein 8 n=1 Tax=Melipona quadrifasciata TaxID=166423 RepID=A0A0M8ZSP0_9HYME|nr:Ribosomal RNA-processing protein 8 [Melipona quadrifasciata]
MAKKLKKNVTDAKKAGKNMTVKQKNNRQKKKSTEDDENKFKPAILKDQNLKFKSKSTKNKLTKTVKQIYKNDKKRVCTDFLNSDTIKVVNVEKKDNNKVREQVQNKKNQQLNNKKLKRQKQNKKNKISDQSKSTINVNKIARKTKSKSIEPETKEKQKLNKKKNLNEVLEKKLKQRESKFSTTSKKKNDDTRVTRNHNLDIKHLQKLLSNKQKEEKQKVNMKPQSLRQKMMTKLKASRFRYLNETLYNNESSESKKYFKNNPDAFKAYHEGYKQQVEQWPVNPLDNVIASIKKMPNQYIIADFGCGEARLAATVSHKVHSFDFVSLNKNVIGCNIAHTPLLTNSVNVVVFCLSLMGTNLKDYIIEANRVLKKGGILKIAEVESRFERVEDFINAINGYGFKNIWKDLSHKLFYFLDFKKEGDISGERNKLPSITLKPCFYKKR